jgi:hypothetical protein
MATTDNHIIAPKEWYYAKRHRSSSKRLVDAARAIAAPPTKRIKTDDEGTKDRLIREVARLTYEQHALQKRLKMLRAAIAEEEERSTRLERVALKYRKKWMEGSTVTITVTHPLKAAAHHKNEAQRLASAANKERQDRLESYHEWRIQAHFDATRLLHPLLTMRLQQILKAPLSLRQHPFQHYPHGEVVYSLD